MSISCLSTLAVILRLAPAPITRIGLRAVSSLSTAACTALFSASGRRCRLGGIGVLSVCSAAMSSGSSRCTAPGFSSSARRKASRMRAGMLSAEANWWVYLVIGAIIPHTSMIWNRPCLDFLIGFCPVIIIMGMPPRYA
ncbi:hypothetical protein D3C73_907990 [compost metagenome]